MGNQARKTLEYLKNNFYTVQDAKKIASRRENTAIPQFDVLKNFRNITRKIVQYRKHQCALCEYLIPVNGCHKSVVREEIDNKFV